MKRIITLGLVSALLVGTAGVAAAQDLNVNGDAELGVEANELNMGVDTGIDASTTGSISPEDQNYGTVVSGLQSGAGTSADITAFSDSSTINCVTVSSLQGNTDNAAALDNAISANEAQLAVLRGQIEGSNDFMSDLQASCDVPELEANQIVSVRTSADGHYTVYIDDRA